MALNFTIRSFIDNRWAEAKEELTQQDPTFIAAVQSYEFLQDKLFLPEVDESIHPPRGLLDERWVHLLEATENVYLEVEDLLFTVSLIESAITSRASHYHADKWVESAYSLCEKVKVLITHSCRVHGLGRLDDKYCNQIDSKDVQGKIGLLRHPLVHGEGGGGSVVRRAISEDEQHSWELYVAIGPGLLDYILEADPKEGQSPSDKAKILGGHTTTLLANVSGVLSQLEQDINKVKARRKAP